MFNFQSNVDGVVMVTFSTPEEADTCLNFLNNALFDYPGSGGARQLIAERWDGKKSYVTKECKEDEEERIRNWEKFLGDESQSDEEELENTESNVLYPVDEDDAGDVLDTDEEDGGGSSGAETS